MCLYWKDTNPCTVYKLDPEPQDSFLAGEGARTAGERDVVNGVGGVFPQRSVGAGEDGGVLFPVYHPHLFPPKQGSFQPRVICVLVSGR